MVKPNPAKPLAKTATEKREVALRLFLCLPDQAPAFGQGLGCEPVNELVDHLT